ncbi:MAG: hypothetical protein AAFU79_35720, partial [Myxococcota bacterium]
MRAFERTDAAAAICERFGSPLTRSFEDIPLRLDKNGHRSPRIARTFGQNRQVDLRRKAVGEIDGAPSDTYLTGARPAQS